MVLQTAVEHFWRNWEAAEQTHRQLNEHPVLPHIVTSNVEHDSVKLAAEHLEKNHKAGRKGWQWNVSEHRKWRI